MAHDRESVGVTVRKWVVDNLLEGDARGLDDDTNLAENNLLDSFLTVQLLSFIEETFDFEIPRERINSRELRSIASISNLVVETLQLQTTEGSRPEDSVRSALGSR